MLGSFFNDGDQNQTEEEVRNAMFFDDEGNFFHEEDGGKADEGKGDDEGDNAFGEGQFGLFQIDVPVFVFGFVFLKDVVVDAVVAADLEEKVAGEEVR